MNINKLFDLSGRCAIITGGSRGLGREIAEGLITNEILSRESEMEAEEELAGVMDSMDSLDRMEATETETPL